jgi:hypothetical protein
MSIHRMNEYRFTIEPDGEDMILRLDGEPLGAHPSREAAEYAANVAAQEIRPGTRLEFRSVGENLEANLVVKDAE